jgi:Trp operon repressor
MTTFEKCIELSRELDDIKHVESLTNYGVCLYFCGRFSDSYLSLEKAREISNKLIENYLNDKSIQYLHLRVLCNLSLTSLSLNKISDSKSLFKDCIELIKSQFEVHEKINMLKELVYIFFRIDSLKNYNDQNAGINLDAKEDNDVSMMNGKMISKTLYSLHKTLRENNIEHWMKCLNDEAKKLRSLKDINGYVFVLINSFAANFYQSGKISEGVKTNFSKILKIYAEQYNKDLKLKEKNLNVIFTDFKNRIDTAIEIYKKLLDTEAELNNLLESLNQDKNHITNSVNTAKSNKIFIRLFFKHALRQLNENLENQNQQQLQTNNSQVNLNALNLNNNPQLNFIGVNNNNIQVNAYNNNDVKNQIELALKLVDNDEFDCSKLNIFNINSEITKSLRILFENLVSIRNKCLLNIYFKNYMSKTFGFYSIMVKRDFKSQEFMDKRLEAVYKGKKFLEKN